jgi:hypothetical protein
MVSEPENSSGLKQPQSFKLRLKNALGVLWTITFSTSWFVGMYVKAYRPMHPIPSLGLTYPLSWTYGCAACAAYYVTRLEYVLAGPAAQLVWIGTGISFAAASIVANRETSN